MRRALVPLLAGLCAAVLPVAFAPAPALAQTQTQPQTQAQQQDDRDYLTALLEDTLSDAGRKVTISGFQGALSSQAQLAELTIADQAGVWLSLRDVALDWQRSDLLEGKITITSLTAAEITLSRLPQASAALPTAEAPAFSLPELPVAISIGAIRADLVHLGAPVLGEAVSARASAALTLANGEGTGQLSIERLDANAPQGLAHAAVSYTNASRDLALDLRISEGQGGLLARAMGLAQRPALDFSVQGSGPLNDFSAQIALRRDGQAQLRGQVDVSPAASAGGTRFDLSLAGDLSQLVPPDYQPFFGAASSLQLRGQTRPMGGADIAAFNLSTAAMTLSGQMAIDAAGRPERVALSGVLENKAAPQTPLILPLGLDRPARVTRAEITAAFDETKGEDWRAAIALENWDQGDLRIARAGLNAAGQLRKDGATTEFTADLALDAEGVQPNRMALSRALGHVIWGAGRVEWRSGQDHLALRGFRLGGEDYQASLDGTLSDLAKGGVWRGAWALEAQDLGRFADVAGQNLGGAAKLAFDGAAVLLTGAFDGVLQAQGQDLSLGQRAIDASLAGESRVVLDAQRGAGGIDLRRLSVQARGGGLDLSGRIAGQGTAVSGQFHLADMPRAQRGFAGALQGDLDLRGAFADAAIRIEARSQGLDPGIALVQKLAAGQASLSLNAQLVNLAPRLTHLRLQSAHLRAQADLVGQQPTPQGPTYNLSAALADLGLILPEFTGALTLNGTAQWQADGAVLALSAQGPAGLKGQIAGLVSTADQHDLRLNGQADAGLANAWLAPYSISGQTRFDLALRGAAQLGGVAGAIALENGQLAGPNLPFSLRNLAGQVDLQGGRASLQLRAAPSSGGQITATGQVAAAAPFDSDLDIALRAIGLRNPELYDTTLGGNLRFSGPLLGGGRITGRLDLGKTEVQLRPTDLTPSAPLPMLRHQGDAAAVAATRSKAGRDAPTPSAAPPTAKAAIALDVAIRAMNRLFLRGRGLDVELGGSVRLQGTTQAVRPAGSFDLVQGRFELLSKRLTLESVRLEMQGQLVPYLFVRASNVQGDITTNVIIDGPAIDPEFRFSSSPEMPEEEVLAQLLFAQNLSGLSALQSLQLAGAVASLAGRGNGLLANTRKNLGLDDLDLMTTASGDTALKLGKYVSDKVYTGLSAQSNGQQKLDFTYTLNEKIKLKTGATSQGSTSLGIEFETNY